jgi:hypothetical protein
LSRSWFSHLCGTPYYSRPYSYFYNSRPSTTIIVDSPHETTATAQSREERSTERTFAVIGLITFGIAVIAAIGIFQETAATSKPNAPVQIGGEIEFALLYTNVSGE